MHNYQYLYNLQSIMFFNLLLMYKDNLLHILLCSILYLLKYKMCTLNCIIYYFILQPIHISKHLRIRMEHSHLYNILINHFRMILSKLFIFLRLNRNYNLLNSQPYIIMEVFLIIRIINLLDIILQHIIFHHL